MVKLTEAQRRCLADVNEGIVRQIFDVYGGYAWARGESVTRWCRSEHNAPAPIKSLLQKGAIALGDSVRPYSGHRITPYAITDLGRQALSSNRRGE